MAVAAAAGPADTGYAAAAALAAAATDCNGMAADNWLPDAQNQNTQPEYCD